MKKKTLINNLEEYKEKALNIHFDEFTRDLAKYAHENNVPIIKDEGLAFLLMLLRIKKPARILEIGSAIGYSAILMAKNTDAIIDTFEISEASAKLAKENIKQAEFETRINLYNIDALEGFDLIKDNNYDFIFLDAAKGQYRNFFNLFSPLLNKGGVIFADNLYFHDLLFEEIESRNLYQLVGRIKKYNDFVLEKEDFDTSIFNIGDGIGVSVKK